MPCSPVVADLERERSSSTATRLRSILILSYTIYKGLCPAHSLLIRAQSRNNSQPMRGQYSGHVITLVQ